MKFKTIVAGLVISLAGVVGPVAFIAPTANAAVARQTVHHGCTRTSNHHCIKGGQFCPKAKKGHSGWDAVGRRYVCRGAGSHPHWRKP